MSVRRMLHRKPRFSCNQTRTTSDRQTQRQTDRQASSTWCDQVSYMLFTSDKGWGICDCPWCLSVCLLARLLKKRVYEFGWNFARRQVSGHGRTDQLLSPIRIIVRIPEPENLKVEDLTKSVKQTHHSEQATRHAMHCREILFTPSCSPIKSQGVWRVGSTFLYDVRLRSYGASNLPNFRILAFVGGTCAPPSAL